MKRLLIVRGVSPLRNTTDEEILVSLSENERALRQEIIDLSTMEFEPAVESAYWDSLNYHLQEFASELLIKANQDEGAELLYFGLDEVPSLIALGAFVGDEHRIGCRDYDRDAQAFVWPGDGNLIELETTGLPLERVESEGGVVIKIELSYPINDAEVDEVAPKDKRLATIAIRPANRTPTVGLFRSQNDVELFRGEFRKALAILADTRPNAEVSSLQARYPHASPQARI